MKGKIALTYHEKIFSKNILVQEKEDSLVLKPLVYI